MAPWIDSTNVVKVALLLIKGDKKYKFDQTGQDASYHLMKLKEALYQFVSPTLEDDVFQISRCAIDRMEYALIRLIECTKSAMGFLPTDKQHQLQQALYAAHPSLFGKD